MRARVLFGLMLSFVTTTPAFALGIINYNSKAVDFDIYDAGTCGVDHFVSGTLGAYGASATWDSPSLLYPGERLCLVVESFSSSTVIANNLSSNPYCLVSIRDNGFMMGIRLDLSASCY